MQETDPVTDLYVVPEERNCGKKKGDFTGIFLWKNEVGTRCSLLDKREEASYSNRMS